jgi:hypothetical protein
MQPRSRTHARTSPQEGEQSETISDEELLRKLVTPQMMKYFHAKMPEVESAILIGRICELLKFLMLVRFSPGRILFGKEVDDVWHYWILQTRQYAQLCETLPGKSFRHHSSTVYDQSADTAKEADVREAVQRILSFFISYYRNFGPLAVDRIACWPTLQQVMQEAGWDVVRLNAFLRDQALASPA